MFVVIYAVSLFDSVSSLISRSDGDVSVLPVKGQRAGKSAENNCAGYQEIVPELEIKIGTRTELFLGWINETAFQRIVVQSDQQRGPVTVGLGLGERDGVVIFLVKPPEHGDNVLENRHGEMLIA